MQHDSKTLIFVYNADGTFGAKLRDVYTKVTAPKAQDCNLCAVTYPLIAMDATWRTYTQSLAQKVLFLHRDEFHAQYPSRADDALPAAYMLDAESPHLMLSRDQINGVHSVSDLIGLVQTALQKN